MDKTLWYYSKLTEEERKRWSGDPTLQCNDNHPQITINKTEHFISIFSRSCPQVTTYLLEVWTRQNEQHKLTKTQWMNDCCLLRCWMKVVEDILITDYLRTKELLWVSQPLDKSNPLLCTRSLLVLVLFWAESFVIITLCSEIISPLVACVQERFSCLNPSWMCMFR